MSIRLSGRQHPLLEHFAGQPNTYRMSLDAARLYDQRPFRSALIQGWVKYRRGEGFYLTKAGAEALWEFHHTDIFRKNPSSPLTSYFDPTAYGLRKDTGKVHVMTKRGAA